MVRLSRFLLDDRPPSLPIITLAVACPCRPAFVAGVDLLSQGDTSMRPIRWAVLALVLFAATPAWAGSITSLTSSGPGGTTTLAGVGTATALYTADFTAVAPITIHFSVDGPGTYTVDASPSVHDGTRNVTNSTGVMWTTFAFHLVQAPGAEFVGASFGPLGGPNKFGDATFLPPSPPPHPPITVIFSGGTGVEPGASTPLLVQFNVTAAGASTADLVLTPNVPLPVPEPASLTLAAVCLGGMALEVWRRRRQ
jgi:hypothetical protein